MHVSITPSNCSQFICNSHYSWSIVPWVVVAHFVDKRDKDFILIIDKPLLFCTWFFPCEDSISKLSISINSYSNNVQFGYFQNNQIISGGNSLSFSLKIVMNRGAYCPAPLNTNMCLPLSILHKGSSPYIRFLGIQCEFILLCFANLKHAMSTFIRRCDEFWSNKKFWYTITCMSHELI